MPEDRTKYQLQIALQNGQSFALVTYMNLESIETEMSLARDEQRYAKFDGVDPGDDGKVFLRVDPAVICGYMVMPFKRRPVVSPVPQIVQ